MRRIISCLILFAAASLLTAPLFAGQPTPDYWPTCDSPQNLVPAEVISSSANQGSTALAWNGKEYGVVWSDRGDYHLRFRKMFADGTFDGPEVTVAPSLTSYGNSTLIWNGAGYALAWEARSSSDSYDQTYFALLNPDGSVASGPTRISFVGMTETSSAIWPKMAWNGSEYAVAWIDSRSSSGSGTNVYATLVDASGAVANSGASHDVAVTAKSGNQLRPDIAWDSSGNDFVIVWQDDSSQTLGEIYGNRLYTYGSVPNTYGSALLTGSTGFESPSIVDTGMGLGLAWSDYRNSNWEIYFLLLNGLTTEGSPVNLSNDSHASEFPTVTWTGAEFGVFWRDNRSGNTSIWFQRVSADGVAQGGNYRVFHGGASLYDAGAAFAKYGYFATADNSSNNFGAPWGCLYPYNPPCPGGVMAYGVSTTTATIAWLPVDGGGTDIAYYIVYRDDAPIAKTADTYFTDTGLTSGTTYKYTIHAVNAAQQESTGCSSTSATSSVYVKPSAAVLLKVNKSSPDAVLNWTDTSNMTSYNVYRGTNPQVMQKLGNTSTQSYDDANALTNSNVYFYTVDDPGQ